MIDRVEQTATLDASVSQLKTVSQRRQAGLQRLGISSLRDLLSDYPARYNDFSQISSIIAAPLGQPVAVMGTVRELKLKRPRPRLTIVEATIADDSGIVIASWFNQPWLERALPVGTRVILNGRVEYSFGFRRMNSPLQMALTDDDQAGDIMPVYRANSDITLGWHARAVSEALELLPAMVDPLPARLRLERGLLSRHAALRGIHHPADADQLRDARRRLAFEELLYLQLWLLSNRRQRQASAPATAHRLNGQALQKLKANLPFALTADQQQAASEILADMAQPSSMQRLLLGDVGSGKTVVAALALAVAHDSGYQASMMAPTEVLAEQYALKLGPSFDECGIPWGLLTSSTKAAQRQQLLSGLADGTVSVIFGTHALLEPDVCFKRLSLIVIDEQHRFGVEQRQALSDKGPGSDLLAMTATPIPRSLALTIYGDMETSYIRSKPRPGSTIATKVISKKQMRHAYQAIREAVERGEQAYIVCPLISNPAGDKAAAPDKNDALEANGDDDPVEYLTEFSAEDDGDNIQAAEQELSYLQSQVFADRRMALMTSRLKPAEKRQVMADFRAGLIDILVSTTVVEVGVDVPNATVMVILDADRFGLSQLHQLRGRVGRGERDGAVYLVSGSQNPDSLKRLDAMEKSSDGFELAEYDLRLRREGDILGSRQHGAARLRLVNVIKDADLIKETHQLARQMMDDDPGLDRPEHRLLAMELELLFGVVDGDGNSGGAASRSPRQGST